MSWMEPVSPDGNTPGLRILECSRAVDRNMLTLAIFQVVMGELLSEVPDLDFIEIRAIRLDKEEPDERSAQPAQDPEPPAV